MTFDTPRASRPVMPGDGTLAADEGSGLLPWSWARERLTSTHDYWLATVWPDRRPHVTPVWGIWANEGLWWSCSPGSRTTRNLALNPAAAVTTDDAASPVVVEGGAEVVTDAAAVADLAHRVNAKYEVSYSESSFIENACFRLRPRWAFALRSDDFEGSPTRWIFDDKG
jgi:nitroimidazol reductase NimA-like FMN-containing flavoprotein (pyridoxamine 5'-phosphate oxidase superfamily)